MPSPVPLRGLQDHGVTRDQRALSLIDPSGSSVDEPRRPAEDGSTRSGTMP